MRRLIRHFLTPLALILLACVSPAAYGDKIQVFILAGQSNMDGRGDGSQLSNEDLDRLEKVRDRVRFAYNGEDIRPLGLTVPQPHIGRKFDLQLTFGPELFFGISLAEAWPEKEFLLIKRSLGGTSLYGSWNPQWTPENAAVTNEHDRPRLYTELLGDVDSALSAYDEDDFDVAGMLWVQGETDSNVKNFGPVPAESYGRNLGNLIDSIRRDIGVPELPFLMLQVGNSQVVTGMREVANSKEHVFLIPQSQNSSSEYYLPKYGPPVGHYDYTGMRRIGTLFAAAYLREYPAPDSTRRNSPR